jgi:hypothetical protein
MSLFDVLRSKPYEDQQLGVLKRARGRWKGSINLPNGGAVTLLLSGDRTRPDERSILLGRELPQRYLGLRDEIARHLFEHYEPYREAMAGDQPVAAGEPLPKVDAPNDVWPHTKLERVLIEPLDGVPTVEIAYRVAWDEEHTLGAWVRDWRVFELCGSVGP